VRTADPRGQEVGGVDVMVVNPKLVEDVKKLLERAEWEATSLVLLLEAVDKDPAELFHHLKDSVHILFSAREEGGIRFRMEVEGTRIGELFVGRDGSISGKINITKNDVARIVVDKIVALKGQLANLQNEFEKLRGSTVRGLEFREDD